jgi:hypothetical protein
LLAGIYVYLTPFPLPSLPYLSRCAPPVTPVVSVIPDRFDDFSSPASGWDIIWNDPTGTADNGGEGTYLLNVNGGKFFSSLWQELGDIGGGDFVLTVSALGPWGDQGVGPWVGQNEQDEGGDQGELDTGQGAVDQGIVIGWQKEDLSRPNLCLYLDFKRNLQILVTGT